MASIPSSLLRIFEPIESYLTDPSVRRVMVDGPDRVFVERDGRLERAEARYGAEALAQSLEGLARRAGKGFDAERPCLEAMLKDGTRFLALRPPVTDAGPVLCITRPTGRAVEMAEVVGRDRMLPAPAADALVTALRAGLNIAVAGPPGSGRQMLVEALCSTLAEGARVAVVDESSGLQLPGRQPVRLKPRKAGAQKRAVSGGDLMYCAGRLGVDRVVTLELRQSDAWDAVSLLASRAAPVLLALPGITASDSVARLEGLARASTSSQRARGVPALLGAGLDVVVSLATRDRRRRVVGIDTIAPGVDGPVATPLYSLVGGQLRATDRAHRWSERLGAGEPEPARGPETPDESETGVISLAGMLEDAPAEVPFEIDVPLASLVPLESADLEPASPPGALDDAAEDADLAATEAFDALDPSGVVDPEADEALPVEDDDDDDDEEDPTVVTEISAEVAQELLSKKTFSQVLRSIGTTDEEDDSEWDASSDAGAAKRDRNTVVHSDEE